MVVEFAEVAEAAPDVVVRTMGLDEPALIVSPVLSDTEPGFVFLDVEGTTPGPVTDDVALT